MRLKDNKEESILDKIFDGIYWSEDNIRKSDWRVLTNQDIWVRVMVKSNELIRGIYDEITSE